MDVIEDHQELHHEPVAGFPLAFRLVMALCTVYLAIILVNTVGGGAH